MKVVLDSSALIEILLEGPRAHAFQAALDKATELVVPAVCLHETYRFVAAHQDSASAEDYAQSLKAHSVCPVDADLSLTAARLGRRYKLALADSLVYATARECEAELWTQDADFKELPGVRYLPKKKV